MEQPREVTDIIEAMKAAGWEAPTVQLAHFNIDGTGPFMVTISWGHSQASYQSDRGWIGVHGPRGMTYPYYAESLPQECVGGLLLQWATRPT